MAQTADWIAVDWGASDLRAWAMRGEEVLDQANVAQGVTEAPQGGFEAALMALVGKWINGATTPVDVIVCGMAGARRGWAEVPCRAVPAEPLAAGLVTVPGTPGQVRVLLVPGLKQDRPADLMHGDETRVAGYLAAHPNWDGVICLPGPLTRWVHASAGEVVSFQTFMTGELFDLLAHRSVLRDSIGAGRDAAAFAEALDDSMARPERLAAHLFGLRARDLLQGVAPEVAAAQLSGLLIGAELAAARPYWLGQQVVIIGTEDASRPYASALERQGVMPRRIDERDMTLAGLSVARRALRGPA